MSLTGDGNGRTILLYLNDTLNYILLSSQLGFQDALRIPNLLLNLMSIKPALQNPLFGT